METESISLCAEPCQRIVQNIQWEYRLAYLLGSSLLVLYLPRLCVDVWQQITIHDEYFSIFHLMIRFLFWLPIFATIVASNEKDKQEEDISSESHTLEECVGQFLE